MGRVRHAAVIACLFSAGCFSKKPPPESFVCGAGECRVELTIENRDDLPRDLIARVVGMRTADVCSFLVPGESSITCTSTVPLGAEITFDTVLPSFGGWEEDCAGQEGMSCTVEVSRPIRARAVFGCPRSCDGTLCGADGCGGTCECVNGAVCVAGVCDCNRDCSRGSCGLNPCGGLCVCPPGTECNRAFHCECVPSCGGNVCGDNGCGGTCGTCPPSTECDGGACVPTCPSVAAPRVPVVILLDGTTSMSEPFGTRPCDECPLRCALDQLAALSRRDRVVAAWLDCSAAGDGLLDEFRPLAPATLSFNSIGVDMACFGDPESAFGATILALPSTGSGSALEGLAAAASMMRDRLTGASSSTAAIVFMGDSVGSGSRVLLDFACTGETETSSVPATGAAYLFRHDVLCGIPGTQRIRTYVIGIDPPSPESSDELAAMAAAGGGLYFGATTATAAQDALRTILTELER